MGVIPKQRNIDDVFSNTKYYLDFYQRDYKWTKKHIESLLDDIFFKFNGDYEPGRDINEGSIKENFDWYYTHTYVTNVDNGNTYVVDGQQRFTTFALILIKLKHLSEDISFDNIGWLKRKIIGEGPEGRSYWMGANGRERVLNKLFEHDKSVENLKDVENLSHRNMYKNYKTIKKYLERELENDPHKLETFIYYILLNVQMIEIEISDSKDVSMVFEVINDRGESLKPYEVLKGKLLGQIVKSEVDKYYNIWKKQVHKLQNEDEEKVDDFFRHYFRSRYITNQNEYKEFDGEYHKTIFEQKWNEKINLKREPQEVKDFIKNEFQFYSNQYLAMLEKTKEKNNEPLHKGPIYYNHILDQNRQYLLMMSTLNNEDPLASEKKELVATLYDKHFAILHLLGCYNSNDFTQSLMDLNREIRGANLDEIKREFEQKLLEDIEEERGIRLSDPFHWGFFKEAHTGIGTNFTRYFLTRVEDFIDQDTDSSRDKFYNLASNRGSKNGYHIEHILANNDENLAKFENDKELFARERNRLGAVVLLNRDVNFSSGNEIYEDKLKTYATKGTLWAKTLAEDFYHSNPTFNRFKQKYDLDIEPINEFDQEAINKRQKLLFEISKILWDEKVEEKFTSLKNNSDEN